MTTSVKGILKDEVISSQTYKGAEPTGLWVYMSGSGPKTLDYSFTLNYSEVKCSEGNGIKTRDYFTDNDSIRYNAPKLSTGEKTFSQFLVQNIFYPPAARSNKIYGTVNLVFTITKDGNSENIYVQKGSHILLDKEAVRVIRKMKLSTPPTVNGQN